MNRTALITLLQNYCPTASEEIIFKKDMLAFIKSNSYCFERTLESGHVTASCWLVNKDNSEALLTHHMKLDRWFQLGGHCDGETDVLGVAIKEAQEESGINAIEPVSSDIFDIDIHLIPENKREKAHYHYDVRFLLRVTSDEQTAVSHESKELRWISKELSQLPSHEPSMVRMFTKWTE